MLLIFFVGEAEEFLKLAKIVVPETAEELDDVFLQQRQYFPPEGGGAPKPPTPEKTKAQQAAENAKKTQQFIAESGINVTPAKPEGKKKRANVQRQQQKTSSKKDSTHVGTEGTTTSP